MRIRPANTAGDAEAIAAIYAPFVTDTVVSFEDVPPTADEMATRIERLTSTHPWLVAEDAGEIAGYAYATPYRSRPAYRHTVENSIYVRVDRLGTGLGKLLLPALIAATQICGMHQMVAVIGDSANLASIRLHRRFGFRDAGLLKDVGFKFDRWLDTVFMQRSLLQDDL